MIITIKNLCVVKHQIYKLVFVENSQKNETLSLTISCLLTNVQISSYTVGVAVEYIDVGVVGLGFDSRAGKIVHCRQQHSTAATFLCCSGAMRRRWALPFVTRFDEYWLSWKHHRWKNSKDLIVILVKLET